MEGHIIAAFLQYFNVSSVDDAPKSVMMQKLATAKDKPTAFHRMVSEMLSKHIDLPIRAESTSSRGDDGGLSYAEEVLTLSLRMRSKGTV